MLPLQLLLPNLWLLPLLRQKPQLLLLLLLLMVVAVVVLLQLLSLLSQGQKHAGPGLLMHHQHRCFFSQGRAVPHNPHWQCQAACTACPACSHHHPHRLWNQQWRTSCHQSPLLQGKMVRHKQQLPWKLLSRCCRPSGILRHAILFPPRPAPSRHPCHHTSHHCLGPLHHSRHSRSCRRHSQPSQKAQHGRLAMLVILGMLCRRFKACHL